MIAATSELSLAKAHGESPADGRRGVIDKQGQGAPGVLPLRFLKIAVKIGMHQLACPFFKRYRGHGRQPS
jgi:hypothetical protein